MKQFAKCCTCFLCVLIVFGFAMTVFAADSIVTYKGRDTGFEYAPESTYVETDLFDDFKQVMPGDKRTEKITITNECGSCDYITVYMCALLHDDANNPISPKVLEKLTEDERRGLESELEYMHDFLKQLTLTVWNGKQTEKNVIYTGSPDSLETGFENEKVFLGSLYYGQSVTLNAQLEVSIEMGNEYADRIGEVDWIFVVEERFESRDDDEPTKEQIKETEAGETKKDSYNDSDLVERGEEEGGFALNVLPMTGDSIVIWPYILLMIASLIGIIVLIGDRQKKDKE